MFHHIFHKKEWSTDSCYNVGGLEKHPASDRSQSHTAAYAMIPFLGNGQNRQSPGHRKVRLWGCRSWGTQACSGHLRFPEAGPPPAAAKPPFVNKWHFSPPIRGGAGRAIDRFSPGRKDSADTRQSCGVRHQGSCLWVTSSIRERGQGEGEKSPAWKAAGSVPEGALSSPATPYTTCDGSPVAGG